MGVLVLGRRNYSIYSGNQGYNGFKGTQMKCSVHVPFPGYTNLPNYIPGKGHTQRQQITKQMVLQIIQNLQGTLRTTNIKPVDTLIP